MRFSFLSYVICIYEQPARNRLDGPQNYDKLQGLLLEAARWEDAQLGSSSPPPHVLIFLSFLPGSIRRETPQESSVELAEPRMIYLTIHHRLSARSMLEIEKTRRTGRTL